MIKMESIKTITNFSELKEFLKDEKNLEKDKVYFDFFFKNKTFKFEGQKIIYPELSDLKKQISDDQNTYNSLKENIAYWKKEKEKLTATKLSKYINKKYWKHQIKKLTDKQYKQDLLDTKLTDDVILDPEYDKLFQTFYSNPDYRKKLKETVNTSIVYRNTQIGKYSQNKRDLKKNIAEQRILQLQNELKDLEFRMTVNNKIMKFIQKYS